MNKIMFNDRYGLTKAVLDRRKIMTRREPVFYDGKPIIESRNGYHYISTANGILLHKSRYHIGEIVAVAQPYKDICTDFESLNEVQCMCGRNVKKDKSWNNKMFVKPNLMPHHIRITDIKVERLQDCSDDDMLKEGILQSVDGMDLYTFDGWVKHCKGHNLPIQIYTKNIREAFAALIDKVSGKGTWESNPYVFVYEFELID